MLLTDIYYQAGEIEANALCKPSWAKPHEPAARRKARISPRRIVGRALIGLGRLIAAEPAPANTPVRVGH